MERGEENVGWQEEEWLPIPRDLSGKEADYILSDRRAKLWALVLEARYLPFRIEHGFGGTRLFVPARSFAASIEELLLYEKENRGWPYLLPKINPLAENTLATLSVLVLLATFHNITRLDTHLFGHNPVDWISLGNADAAKILDGQWWRLITALTLHADLLHLLSNLTIGGIFIVFLCRELGSGLAWSLLLASGSFGNLTNAALQMPDHRSVGASTLVFGAVGILAAISMLRYRKQLQRRWPLPIAAAMALLALLGTEGKQTDLGAHLFGFLFGIVLGLVAEFLVERSGRPGRGLNAFLATCCIAVVCAAWWAALVWGG